MIPSSSSSEKATIPAQVGKIAKSNPSEFIESAVNIIQQLGNHNSNLTSKSIDSVFSFTSLDANSDITTNPSESKSGDSSDQISGAQETDELMNLFLGCKEEDEQTRFIHSIQDEMAAILVDPTSAKKVITASSNPIKLIEYLPSEILKNKKFMAALVKFCPEALDLDIIKDLHEPYIYAAALESEKTFEHDSIFENFPNDIKEHPQVQKSLFIGKVRGLETREASALYEDLDKELQLDDRVIEAAAKALKESATSIFIIALSKQQYGELSSKALTSIMIHAGPEEAKVVMSSYVDEKKLGEAYDQAKK